MKKKNFQSLKLNKRAISNFELTRHIGGSGSCGVCQDLPTETPTCGTATVPFSYLETMCLPPDGPIPLDPKKM